MRHIAEKRLPHELDWGSPVELIEQDQVCEPADVGQALGVRGVYLHAAYGIRSERALDRCVIFGRERASDDADGFELAAHVTRRRE
jgi:hypothetical protein